MSLDAPSTAIAAGMLRLLQAARPLGHGESLGLTPFLFVGSPPVTTPSNDASGLLRPNLDHYVHEYLLRRGWTELAQAFLDKCCTSRETTEVPSSMLFNWWMSFWGRASSGGSLQNPLALSLSHPLLDLFPVAASSFSAPAAAAAAAGAAAATTATTTVAAAAAPGAPLHVPSEGKSAPTLAAAMAAAAAAAAAAAGIGPAAGGGSGAAVAVAPPGPAHGRAGAAKAAKRKAQSNGSDSREWESDEDSTASHEEDAGRRIDCNHPGCDKSFTKPTNLRRHEKLHLGVRPFACGHPDEGSLCGKKFARRADLRSHERSHTGEKPYGCDHCPRRFARNSDWRSHERTHLGVRPFACLFPDCEKAFSRRTDANKHVRSHPGGHAKEYEIPEDPGDQE